MHALHERPLSRRPLSRPVPFPAPFPPPNVPFPAPFPPERPLSRRSARKSPFPLFPAVIQSKILRVILNICEYEQPLIL